MNKRIWLTSISLLLLGAAISFSFTKPSMGNEVNDEFIMLDQGEQDWNECVQKANSEWGGGCLNYGFSEEKYSISLVNTCDKTVDLMSCVQRTNNRWTCFYRMDMHKNDTLHAYACQGSGKFLKWVRQAGDVTTKFPTREQVNDQY